MKEIKPRAGRPKDEQKRAAILNAAGTCFLKYGFEGTSMDAIARAAGVSKLTVYGHFLSKDLLFKAMVSDKCDQFSPPASFLTLADEEPRKALTRIATGFVRLMMTPEVIAMHRVVIGEAGKNPKIAELLYEAGPRPTKEAFAELLRAWVKRGLLEVRRPERAAAHFFHMLKGEPHHCLLLNIMPVPADAELKRHVDDCVETFLRAFAPRR